MTQLIKKEEMEIEWMAIRPHREYPGVVEYLATVELKNLPEIPNSSNVRSQNINRAFYKKELTTTILNSPMLNLVSTNLSIFAEKVEVKKEKDTPTKLVMHFGKYDGCYNGAHRLKTAAHLRNELKDKGYRSFNLSILTGVKDLPTRVSIAKAHNSGIAPTDYSLINALGGFDHIKAALEEQPYASQVFYRQNEKGVCITELIRYFLVCNPKLFPTSKDSPALAYSSKMSNQFYKDRISDFEPMAGIYDDLIRMAEYIRFLGPIKMIQNHGQLNTDAQHMMMAKHKKKIHGLVYTDQLCSLQKVLILMVLASFRHLLRYDEETKRVEWTIPRNQLFDFLEFAVPKLLLEIRGRQNRFLVMQAYAIPRQIRNAKGDMKLRDHWRLLWLKNRRLWEVFQNGGKEDYLIGDEEDSA